MQGSLALLGAVQSVSASQEAFDWINVVTHWPPLDFRSEGAETCSHEERMAAFNCWYGLKPDNDDDGRYVTFVNCCEPWNPSNNTISCWDEGQDMAPCCKCFQHVRHAVIVVKQVFADFYSGTHVDPVQLARAHRLLSNVSRGAPLEFGLDMLWKALMAIKSIVNPAIPASTWSLRVINQLYKNLHGIRIPEEYRGMRGLMNSFDLTYERSHAPVFHFFPAVHGPAAEGQFLDFLGVSNNLWQSCDRYDTPLMLNRALQCRSYNDWTADYKSGGSGGLPVMDEEYFEYADILESALVAARTGSAFAMADVGAGEVALWALRAAVAFDRLAPADAPCDILLIEPDLNMHMFQEHVHWNMVPGRCHFHVAGDWVGDRGDGQGRYLTEVLDGALPQARLWSVIDIDIQGAEMSIIGKELHLLADRAQKLHISTHSRREHAAIVELLRAAGWAVPLECPPLSACTFEEWGTIVFRDGHLTAIPPSHVPHWGGRGRKPRIVRSCVFLS
eukprot:TRINITY_DN91622_c0_g1_i1.p1 TRINITY_DN91622_c0_g1~~TRINITY_DN91622_c0_g1_i1.p1  ORF type:complete len:503 (-),score=44.60 TRINITY_DN91622_c0_g1_i1:36-1544(-)